METPVIAKLPRFSMLYHVHINLVYTCNLHTHTCMCILIQVAVYCQREVRRWAAKSQRQSKEVNSVQPRARKVTKEVISYWRKYEKVEKEARKKAEKEAQEQQKLYDEMREVFKSHPFDMTHYCHTN